MTGLLVVERPARRVRGRRWRVRDTACVRQEHYRDFPDCRCRVFGNKIDALVYAGGEDLI